VEAIAVPPRFRQQLQQPGACFGDGPLFRFLFFSQIERTCAFPAELRLSDLIFAFSRP
jgi:hypothetical protein